MVNEHPNITPTVIISYFTQSQPDFHPASTDLCVVFVLPEQTSLLLSPKQVATITRGLLKHSFFLKRVLLPNSITNLFVFEAETVNSVPEKESSSIYRGNREAIYSTW
jgi:hypothetical protein